MNTHPQKYKQIFFSCKSYRRYRDKLRGVGNEGSIISDVLAGEELLKDGEFEAKRKKKTKGKLKRFVNLENNKGVRNDLQDEIIENENLKDEIIENENLQDEIIENENLKDEIPENDNLKDEIIENDNKMNNKAIKPKIKKQHTKKRIKLALNNETTEKAADNSLKKSDDTVPLLNYEFPIIESAIEPAINEPVKIKRTYTKRKKANINKLQSDESVIEIEKVSRKAKSNRILKESPQNSLLLKDPLILNCELIENNESINNNSINNTMIDNMIDSINDNMVDNGIPDSVNDTITENSMTYNMRESIIDNSINDNTPIETTIQNEKPMLNNSIFFPDDSSSNLESLTLIDLNKLATIIEYFNSLKKRTNKSTKKRRNIHKIENIHLESNTIKHKEENHSPASPSGKRHSSSRIAAKEQSDISQDPRYLYFIKKVCNLGKKDSIHFLKDQQKHLQERNRRNTAELLNKPPAAYKIDNLGININTLNSKNENISLKIHKIEKINKLKTFNFNMVEFEYAAYRFKDNFKKISEILNLSIKDTILIYYINHHRVLHISESLLHTIIEREWSEMDRILFEANFRRYNKKFSKYQINKTERELKIYYRYYSEMKIPENWTLSERSLFASKFDGMKKNWNNLAVFFENKSISDLKQYYNSYFKRLTDEERSIEISIHRNGSIDNTTDTDSI